MNGYVLFNCRFQDEWVTLSTHPDKSFPVVQQPQCHLVSFFVGRPYRQTGKWRISNFVDNGYPLHPSTGAAPEICGGKVRIQLLERAQINDTGDRSYIFHEAPASMFRTWVQGIPIFPNPTPSFDVLTVSEK